MPKRHRNSYKKFKSIHAFLRFLDTLKQLGDEAATVSGCCTDTMRESLQKLSAKHLSRKFRQKRMDIHRIIKVGKDH